MKGIAETWNEHTRLENAEVRNTKVEYYPAEFFVVTSTASPFMSPKSSLLNNLLPNKKCVGLVAPAHLVDKS